MQKLIAIVALMASTLSIVGCNYKSATPPVGTSSVAVVDMDRVAKAMGWMDEINKSMQQNETELKSQLTDVVNSRVKAVEAKRTAIIADAKLTSEQSKKLEAAKTREDLDALPLTRQQREDLEQTVAKANADLQSAQNQYAEALQNRRTKLIVSYRERVRPIAGRLAAARGVSVVLIPADNLLYFDPKTADLTDAIIEELQKGTSSKSPAAP